MITAAFLLAAGLSVAGATSASAVNIADQSTVALIAMPSTMAGGGPCSARQAISTPTRVRTLPDGENGEFDAATTNTFIWNSTHQAAFDVIAARAETTRTTFTPATGTSYTLYQLKEGSTSAFYFCHAGQVDLLINGADSITGWVVAGSIFFTAGEASGAISGPTTEQIAAVQAAIAAAIVKAKTTLHGSLQGDKPGTLDQYRAADYKVNNDKVVEKVNAAVLKLPLADRENAEKIAAIIKVENFVDLASTAATQKRVTSKALVELGLVAADNPNKTTIANALKKSDATSLNSIEKIQEVIKAELGAVKERKDLLAQIRAKIAARKK